MLRHGEITPVCFLTDLESLVSQEYHSTTASTQTGIYHATMFGAIKEAIRAKDQFAYKRLEEEEECCKRCEEEERRKEAEKEEKRREEEKARQEAYGAVYNAN